MTWLDIIITVVCMFWLICVIVKACSHSSQHVYISSETWEQEKEFQKLIVPNQKPTQEELDRAAVLKDLGSKE